MLDIAMGIVLGYFGIALVSIAILIIIGLIFVLFVLFMRLKFEITNLFRSLRR